MGLRETLHRAGEHGREAAHHGMEAVRAQLDEAQSAVRRRMRLHPQTTPKISSHPDADTDPAALRPSEAAVNSLSPQDQGNKPIVSIHGKDITDEATDERKIA